MAKTSNWCDEGSRAFLGLHIRGFLETEMTHSVLCYVSDAGLVEVFEVGLAAGLSASKGARQQADDGS